MTLRLLAVISCIVAIIFFVITAIGTTPPHPALVDWGLVFLTAAVAFLALEGVVPDRRP